MRMYERTTAKSSLISTNIHGNIAFTFVFFILKCIKKKDNNNNPESNEDREP